MNLYLFQRVIWALVIITNITATGTLQLTISSHYPLPNTQERNSQHLYSQVITSLITDQNRHYLKSVIVLGRVFWTWCSPKSMIYKKYQYIKPDNLIILQRIWWRKMIWIMSSFGVQCIQRAVYARDFKYQTAPNTVNNNSADFLHNNTI